MARLCLVAILLFSDVAVKGGEPDSSPPAHKKASAGGSGAAESDLLGRVVAPFELQDFRGARHTLHSFSEPILVVAFLGTECPLVKLYGPRLAEMARNYAGRGIGFVGINANSQDSMTEMAAFAQRHEIEFPMLKDTANRVADQMGARRTPEVFVLDRDRAIRYWGRIDDQYGVGYVRDAPVEKDLIAALEDLLADRPVARPHRESVGCHIGRIRAADPNCTVTYSNQISRIFQKHCVQCHRPGEIAPFSLTNYREVVGWSETIAEVIVDQRMPPWHADPKHGKFLNSRLMSEEEKSLVFDWVDAGAPEGDPENLPPDPEFVTGWRLPEPPEQVVAMRDRPFAVPASGVVEYQYFVVDPKFTEDKWVRAAEVIPGNRAVVHHAIVFFRAPEGATQRGLGLLTAYVPGQSTFLAPENRARRVPAGSKLIFQMHYTPVGSPQQDTTQVGLLFADPDNVEEELVSVVAINRHFEIPPGAERHPVSAELSKLPKGAKLLAIAPHMHVRGKSFRVESQTSDGEPQVLLNVPHYDFNWQHAYRLATPLPLDGIRIRCQATFDNSENNLVNPDPGVAVRWGDQTWEEMMIAFLEVSLPRDLQHDSPDSLTKEQKAAAQRKTEQLFERFDRDEDRVLRPDELPNALAIFIFPRMDANEDKLITFDEALEGALRTERRVARNRRGQ